MFRIRCSRMYIYLVVSDLWIMLFLHSVINFSRVNRLWLAWAVWAGASTTRDNGSTFHSPRWLQAALAHSVGSWHRHWVRLSADWRTVHLVLICTEYWSRNHAWMLLLTCHRWVHHGKLGRRRSFWNKGRTQIWMSVFRLMWIHWNNRRRMEMATLTLITLAVYHLHVWIVHCALIPTKSMIRRLMDDYRLSWHIAIWKWVIDFISLVLPPSLLLRLLPLLLAVYNEHINA